MIENKKIIVSYSGGLDSSTLLAYFKRQSYSVIAVSFCYGSKQNKVEDSYAQRFCEKYGIERKCIDISFINKHFRSSLLNNSSEEIPEGEYKKETMKSTVVPFRNGIMLGILAGLAESNDCQEIALGCHSGDHSLYPDCREEFLDSMREAIKKGTSNSVILNTPFSNLSKEDIVKIGNCLDVDYSLTYSCYKGKEKHCGKCSTCLERQAAFKETGLIDPTIYEV